MSYYVLSLTNLRALISAGVAAMNVFPALDALPLELEQYAAYPAGEHPRLAAGRIMEGVFFLVDVLQFIAIPLTVLALLAQLLIFRLPVKRISNAVRTAMIVIAAGLFAWHATMLAPKMNRELRSFWSAAETGQVDEAQAHRRAFNAYHPRADAILRTNLLLLLVAAGTSAAAFTPEAARGETTLQPPRLLNSS